MADDRLDKIEKEFADFRKEFNSISANLKTLAGEKAEDFASQARSTARRAISRGEDIYDDVRGHLNYAAGNVESRVKDNPLTTVAIVAAVGFMLGFLSRR